MRKLRGAGGDGGGSSSRVSHEDSDSLRSRQTAQIIDLVSEGEIAGLVDLMRSIYLDGTPVQNADLSYNFTGVSIVERTGTQAQSYIPGYSAVENEVSVSTRVMASASVTRSILNTNIDAARITLFTPRLTYSEPKTGNLVGSSISIAIDVQNNGGGFVEVLADTITGKTTGKYQRAYRVPLTGSGPWDIRVRRITADSADIKLQNEIWWGTYTEIIEAKLRYPNSALYAITFDAQQFNTIPTRGYDIKGIKVKVPYNYDPVTRVYSGTWDGTFLAKWTDNPAWIFYDLITTERYGLGQYVDPAMLDKWTLYNIGQYCDELVSDGFGNMEPRFTCNAFIQTRVDAYKLVQNLASVFRGITYWGGGGLVCGCDKPTDTTMLFTNANVIDGAFTYTGSDKIDRHTVALVTWNDPSNMGKQAVEYVEDLPGMELYGLNETEVVAFGCSSRGQAHRFGRWILNTECRDNESVSFRCGIDGTFVFPGCVFGTGDRNRTGSRTAGRVLSATTSDITLDSAVTLGSGDTYTLSCVLPDGTVESRAVTSSPGTTATLTVAAFSAAPQAMAAWVLASNSYSIELWRCVGLSEPEPGILEVNGITYRPEKFAEVEADLVFQPSDGNALLGVPGSPSNLAISEDLYQTGAEVRTQINISWDGVPGVYWEVTWKINDGNWLTSGRVMVPTHTIYDAQEGSIDVKVVAVSALGLRSAASTAVHLIVGKTAPPVAVESFTVSKVGGVGVAEWSAHADLDVKVGGKIVVRHAQEVAGATWSNSVIVAVYDGNTTTGNLALMTGTYMAKARDSSGNWSEAEVSFVVTEGMASTYTTTTSTIQHPGFSGAKTNTNVDGSNLIISTGHLDGVYEFSSYVDLTTVATRRFEADVGLLGYFESDSIDTRGDIDLWDDIDGGIINDSDATLYAATTNDDPAGTPVWGSWTPFFVADFTCRAIKFKLAMERGSESTNVAVAVLRVDVKVPV